MKSKLHMGTALLGLLIMANMLVGCPASIDNSYDPRLIGKWSLVDSYETEKANGKQYGDEYYYNTFLIVNANGTGSYITRTNVPDLGPVELMDMHFQWRWESVGENEGILRWKTVTLFGKTTRINGQLGVRIAFIDDAHIGFAWYADMSDPFSQIIVDTTFIMTSGVMERVE